jgi:hypothetical protein
VTNQEEVGPSALTTLGAKATGLLVCSGTPPLTSAAQVGGVQTYINQVNAYHAATHDAAANPSAKGIAGFTAISDPWTYQMVAQDGQLQLTNPKPVNETPLLK